jgi:DisA bacterial checkpoint controller nucleotide-binding
MDYCFHSYPRDLAGQITAQWDAAGMVDQLPPEDALTSFLSEAYQASLLREEDRAVVCRLILVNPAELGDDAGPPNGLHVLRFREERPMHEQEIRRLSPTATFSRSLIAVRWDSKQGFLVWGIVNSGLRWINQTDGGRLRGPVVPNRLIIHIRGPGTLVALRGRDRIATLLNGKLQDYGFNIFEASWLSHLQERFGKWVLHECFKGQPHPGATVERDFTRMLAQNVMRRVISQVRRARHGGMMILIADLNWEKLVCASGPISPKYWVEDGKARRRYRELLFTVVRTLSQIGGELGLATVGWEHYQQIKDDRLAELDESIFECAHLLADLMAVDGALVLTAARDIIGFGAEIHVPTYPNEVVYRALDIEGEKSVPVRADECGTRHRAAYRLTRDYPECMVTVVSQDGSVRYVGNRNGKVTFWDILSI